MKKTSLKWQKLPNFRNVWNIKAYFAKTFSLKYTEVDIIRKTILLDFHCFLFDENILFASEVIGLLFSVNFRSSYYFRSIFASFSPDIQPNATFLTETTAICFNSLKKPYKIPVYPHLAKKNVENTKN